MGSKIFEGLGPGTLVPQRGKLPPTDSSIGAEAGFVLSRVDGHTSLDEICLLVPFDEPVTMVLLRRLWEAGAIEVPGVARELRRPPPAAQATPPSAQATPPSAKATPPSAEARPAALTPDQQQRIDAFHSSLESRDAFELLEIGRDADERAVKRAYFKLSKEFHPDRYFGKELGDYRERLTKIFRALKAAFELLSDSERRRAYEESSD